MASRAESDVIGVADQMTRRALNAMENLRAHIARDAEEIRARREDVRATREQVERDARLEVDEFSPKDVGTALRRDLISAFGDDTHKQGAGATPESFAAAKAEWRELMRSRGSLGRVGIEATVQELVLAKRVWDARLIKRAKSRPVVPAEVWRAVDRLSDIYAGLPDLRERLVAERVETTSHLGVELAEEIRIRTDALESAYAAARDAVLAMDSAGASAAAPWSDPAWMSVSPADRLQRVIRIGQFEPQLPQTAAMPPIPALLDFPFASGIAIGASVEHRQEAHHLARSIVMRILAAVPPGQVRFVFFDPVSLGQAVAEFRHLAEFDERLVDPKTWTSERDIEARLGELSDHLEVVISTYLRGQFETIDEYNVQAGEVAEPYVVLVVFDYPEAFTTRASRQLLSLIENGPRCGVHTVLVHDAARTASSEVPLDRLIHSMVKIDLSGRRGNVTLGEPLGAVGLDFTPDPMPPIAVSADGRPTTPQAKLLLEVGARAHTSHTGPVTLERVTPILTKLVRAGLSSQVPELHDVTVGIDANDPDTWWGGVTSAGAYAPIGRAGAQDLAALYFSSTEIAGGAIVVGVPRSGKSTALHAAILSLALIYPPDELELFLIDSKHGVEFKIYERLPHARLVSINSEREFSVSVLESIDAEIKRRAELMKRRAAGRANITEYRAATGEVLARIVLFMDEFHELFEEDDALGHRAFQAFSNIVRQGPFAGVHAVVSSQTLSSMPAMDRSTLSLLPMRVAFMCNEIDADLVMGDGNRDVKALSQQGEGIYNAVRGDAAHNQRFRGMYIPADDRDDLLSRLASKAASLTIDRLPRVFDGDQLASRPLEPVLGTSSRPALPLGEPFSLEPSAAVVLRRGRGANLLLLGEAVDDATAPDAALDGAVQSCLAAWRAQGLPATVVDFIGSGDGEGEVLELLGLCDTLGIDYKRGSAVGDVLALVMAEIDKRRAAADYKSDGRLLVLNGIQRALDLEPEDPYVDAQDGERPSPGAMLANVLREGPEVGQHTVVVTDGLAQFDRRLSRDMLKEFDWRVASSTVAPSDVATITESYGDSEIRQSQLLLVDRGRGKQQRVRAYPRFTPNTLATSNERSSR